MPLHISIGINVGETIAAENDLYGTSVNLAARVCDAAGADRIYVTEIVKNRCDNKKILSFQNKGRFIIKGFAGAVPLYKVLWREDGDGPLLLTSHDINELVDKKVAKAIGNSF